MTNRLVSTDSVDQGDVKVTIRVPEQFFDFTYSKAEWDEAVRTDRVSYLMDLDLSDMEIQDELYGPDGHQMNPLW